MTISQNKSIQKRSLADKLFGSSKREAMLQQEKSRLEAFLSAFPGEYCGWSHDHDVIFSKGFCSALGLNKIQYLSDIQAQLDPSDSAALESFFSRLRGNNIPFSMTAKVVSDKPPQKIYKLSGSCGKNISETDRFYILWLEDVTDEAAARDLFIRESEQKDDELKKLEALLDNVLRPIWLRDDTQSIVWCNKTYADFLGVSKEEIIRDQREIFGQTKRKPADAPQAIPPGKDMAKQALEQNRMLERRTHGIVNGQRILMNISVSPLSDIYKNNAMTIGVAYNVTREEELEIQLKRFEKSNRELLEQLRSAIAIYSTDKKLEFYNTAFAQLWHLEEKFLNTRPSLGMIMEKLRESRRLPEQANFKTFKQRWLSMFTDLISAHEDLLHTPDGKSLRMLVVPHSEGGLMMTFEDVTQNLQLESSYQTLVAVQKETLDNLTEAVAVYGGDGRLRLCNPAFSRLWKLNPEDLDDEPHISKIVERMKPFFHKEEWAEKKNILLSKALERLMHEGRLTRTDNILIEYTTVPLPDGGVLVTYKDVSDSVRIENALREKNAALQEAENLKLDFLTNVSYQLRTPLNAIMGFNDILDQEFFGPLNDRQQEYTTNIKTASNDLLGLINDILDLSTLEAGYMTLEPEETKVCEMLDTIHGLVSEWARKEQNELTLKCPKNIGKLNIDQRRIQQAIISALRNSIAYTPAGGSIELSAKRTENDTVTISIKDTGEGIAAEDLERIFEPFERAKGRGGHEHSLKGGAGLGLSLVRNIMNLHGGSVEIESEVGAETTVHMILPRSFDYNQGAKEADISFKTGKVKKDKGS